MNLVLHYNGEDNKTDCVSLLIITTTLKKKLRGDINPVKLKILYSVISLIVFMKTKMLTRVTKSTILSLQSLIGLGPDWP